jgi:hypothetical protein
MSNPQSLNRYAYVNNNPLNLSDPTGHMPSFNGHSSYNQDGDGNGWEAEEASIFAAFDSMAGAAEEAAANASEPNTATGGEHTGSDGSADAGEHAHADGGGNGEHPQDAAPDGGEHGEPQNPSPTPPAQPLPPGYKPQDVESPCATRSRAVRRDIRSIARTLHGQVTGLQLRQRFPGGQIDPRGQSFGTAVNTLTKNGFSANYSLDHPEGQNFQKQFSDGLWYHVIVNYPNDMEAAFLQPNPSSPTPLVTAHCHATNPQGLTHIIDRIFGP